MRVLTSLALIAVALAAAGCGSGGSKRLSKEEFARRADVICAHYEQQVSALATPRTVQQFAAFAERNISALKRAIDFLRRLKPPQAEQVLARRWFAQLALLHSDAIKLRERAKANDLEGVQRVAASARVDDRATARLATQLGMQVCNATS